MRAIKLEVHSLENGPPCQEHRTYTSSKPEIFEWDAEEELIIEKLMTIFDNAKVGNKIILEIGNLEKVFKC